MLAGGVRDATSNTTTEGGKACHFHQYFWILLGVFSQFRKLVLSHLESLRLERVERSFVENNGEPFSILECQVLAKSKPSK